MDFSTVVALESFFLTLGGVSILFLSEDMLQLCVCWSAAMHLECIWWMSQLYLRTSYTCYMYCNFHLSCYILCNRSFQVTRHCVNIFFNAGIECLENLYFGNKCTFRILKLENSQPSKYSKKSSYTVLRERADAATGSEFLAKRRSRQWLSRQSWSRQ